MVHTPTSECHELQEYMFMFITICGSSFTAHNNFSTAYINYKIMQMSRIFNINVFLKSYAAYCSVI